MGDVKIDLIVRDPETGEIRLVFVEEGPWKDPENSDLLSGLQAKVYDAVDLLLEGVIADRLPESRGQGIRIVLDCFNSPPGAVEGLVATLNAELHAGELSGCIQASPHVAGISVEFNDRGPLNG